MKCRGSRGCALCAECDFFGRVETWWTIIRSVHISAVLKTKQETSNKEIIA